MPTSPPTGRAAQAQRVAGRAAASMAVSRRAANIRRNTASPASRQHLLRSHALTNLNHANALEKRKIVWLAVVRIVSALQDLLEMSGYSLSQMIYNEVVLATGKYSGLAIGAVKLAVGILATNVTKVIARELYKWAPGTKPLENVAFISTALARSKKRIMAIAQNQKVDIRPIVSDFMLNMSPRDARMIGKGLVKDLLDTYVYSPYVSSSSGGGTMCKLCSKASCSSAQKATPHDAARLARIVEKVLQAINALLSIDDRRLTFTGALRKAADSNIPSAMMKKVVVFGAKLTPSTAVVLAGLIAQGLHPFLNSKLRNLGLEIDGTTFLALAVKDLPSLVRFVANDPKANLEPFLVRLVAGAKPIGILGGLAGSRYGVATTEFCSMCKSLYSVCTR